MPTETVDPPAAPAISPFHAALQTALNPPVEAPKETSEPKADTPKELQKSETSKESEPPADTKSASRDALFKKKDAKPAGDDPKPEETAPKSALDEITEPAHKDEKGKKGWEALKTEAKQWESKATQLEREIAERKAAGRDTESLEARLAEKEKKLADYEKLVNRANVELNPTFKEKYIDGRKTAVADARGIIEEIGGNLETFDSAMRLPPKERNTMLREMLAESDAFDRERLHPILQHITALEKEAEAQRSAPEKFLAEEREQQILAEAESRAQWTKTFHVTFDKTVKAMRAEIPLLNKIDGDDEWNSTVEKIESEAKDFGSREQWPIEDGIKVATRAAAYGRMHDLYVQLSDSSEKAIAERDAKIKDMEEELKGIHANSPSLNGRGPGAPAGDSPNPYSEAFAARMKG